MKYALFAGCQYYPSGGWRDYQGMFESIEAALVPAITLDSDNCHPFDWWQVVDLETKQIVTEGDSGVYK